MSKFLRYILVSTMLALMTAGSIYAQAQDTPDYEAWSVVTARAEEAIENNRASEAAMATLREQLVDWREIFSFESSRQRVPVTTLEAQLKGLGPVPSDGEISEIADQRAELKALLAAARAPTRKADLARIESEELIRSVDSLLRSRQANLLLTPGPVPVNPSTWKQVAPDIVKTVRLTALEFVTSWALKRQRVELFASLPQILFFLLLGLVLVTRGISWTKRGLARVLRAEMSAGLWTLAFLLSFGQVVLPMLGVLSLTNAVYASGLPGFRGDVILAVFPWLTFELLLARWLGERVFSQNERPLLTVFLTDKEKKAGRLSSFFLGASIAANSLFGVMARYDNWEPETQAVVFFILTVIAALMLTQIALLVGKHSDQVDDPANGVRSSRGQTIFVASRVMLSAAGAGSLLALVGLTQGAAYLVFATAKTSMIIAFLLVTQGLIKKIFAALVGNDEENEDRLLAPVLVGFLLIVLSLPTLALIWGARVSDLTEFWARLAEGLRIGETVISPKDVIIFFLVFLIGYGLTRLAQGTMRNTILPKTQIDPGGQTAIVSGLGYVGIFLAALVAINTAGIDLGNIAILAGALSVGIGFGLQTIVSNFVSGIILLIERPVSEGDWIEVGGQMGYVRDISVRSTRIETFDRTDVIVPNSDLISGTVTNYTRGNTVGRVVVPVGVAYGTDTRRVENILREIANAHPMVLAAPAPNVVFQGFGADSLDFEIRAILRDVNWVLSVKSEINHEIARRFNEESIEIPFAQRDVWLRNPETLTRDAERREVAVDAAERDGIGLKSSQINADLPKKSEDREGKGDER